MTTPAKGDDAGDTDVQTDQRNESRDSLSPRDSSRESDIIYSGAEPDNLDDVDGKILQLIHCSYPKVTMKKMRKLFLFIIHFGNEVLKFNKKGNVTVNGQIIDEKSNILDLLEASVSDQFPQKPVGYQAFMQALRDINVPSNFFLSGQSTGKLRQRKLALNRWKPY